MTPSSPAVRGAAGLANATGEYNCFLNVVVQSLWHLPPFRRQLLAIDAAARRRGTAAAARHYRVLRRALGGFRVQRLFERRRLLGDAWRRHRPGGVPELQYNLVEGRLQPTVRALRNEMK